MNTELIQVICAGGLLFSAVLTAQTLRLQVMLRLYAVASLFLAGFTMTLGFAVSAEHLFYAAGATFLIKVLLIPSIIGRMANRVGASMRLVSSLRSTTTLFLVIAVLFGVLFSIRESAFFAMVEPTYALFISISLVLIGFIMMVVRRDIYSEIIGFLTLENGISMFSVTTIGSGPALVEAGIFSVILIGAVLMTLLSRRVCEMYGTGSTDSMRELID